MGEKSEKSIVSHKIWPLLTGRFINNSFGECEVAIVGANLIATVAGVKIVLEPVADTDFIMHGGPGDGGNLTYEKDAAGNYNKFVANGYIFERVTKEKDKGTKK